jgi:hypothetical protein
MAKLGDYSVGASRYGLWLDLLEFIPVQSVEL